MTDRNRVITDPGLGPIEREHTSTLRSMIAAEPIPEEEIPGAPMYFGPKPLHAVSEHKTIELETVKLAKDIDPRKLPTELKLRRPVLHVLPASDPNWPAPHRDAGSASPLFDSNWPPPETVLTTSTRPFATRRRSFVPLVLLVVLAACLVVGLGARRAWHRAGAPAVQAAPALALVATAASNIEPLPSAPLTSESGEATSANAAVVPADSTAPTESAEPTTAASAAASAPAASASASAQPAASAAPPLLVEAPHHAPLKSTAPSNANSSALSALPRAKLKRAIY